MYEKKKFAINIREKPRPDGDFSVKKPTNSPIHFENRGFIGDFSVKKPINSPILCENIGSIGDVGMEESSGLGGNPKNRKKQGSIKPFEPFASKTFDTTQKRWEVKQWEIM